jgi:thiol-disulfide isomerase/thioredoxin
VPPRNRPAPPTRRALLRQGAAFALLAGAAEAREAPLFRTAQGQFVFVEPRADVSAVQLGGLGGPGRAIASWRGKALLVAFWASWCPPCRRELPILAGLQAEARHEAFDIAPVALDHDPAQARRFLAALGLQRLASFEDSAGTVASGPGSERLTPFRLYGMPIAYLVDRESRLVGYLAGEADWASPPGRALLRHFGRP